VAKGIAELKREVKRLRDETEKCDASMRENVDAQCELATEIERFEHIARETKTGK
jgi:hypothetical protein